MKNEWQPFSFSSLYTGATIFGFTRVISISLLTFTRGEMLSFNLASLTIVTYFKPVCSLLGSSLCRIQW